MGASMAEASKVSESPGETPPGRQPRKEGDAFAISISLNGRNALI